MKVIILGSFGDKQTANYIIESFKGHVYDVAGVDIRGIIQDCKDRYKAQEMMIKEIQEVRFKPDLILVLKGLEMTQNTLNKIRKLFPKAKIVNWFFDVYIGDQPIWENKSCAEMIRFYDYYFCSLKGVADKLKEAGHDNARWLPEACYPEKHGPIYMNEFQKRKYGCDISFCGNLGYTMQHKDRVKTLEKLEKEGFHFKIWGRIVADWKEISPALRHFYQHSEAINEQHSMVCQASYITLGIDQDSELELSQSARLYRVLCAGGLYLNNATKGLEKMFKINPPDKKPTGEEDLVVYYDLNHLVELLDFLLEHKDIREKIAKNGLKAVKEHTFSNRIKDMLKIIKGKKDGQKNIY